MPKKTESSDMLVCSESANVAYEGGFISLVKDQTRVARGSAIAKLYPNLFKPAEVHFGAVEQATKAPGEKRAQTKRSKS